MAMPETLQDVIAILLGTDPADVHPDIAFAGTRLQARSHARGSTRLLNSNSAWPAR